jgi:hypothetical protein
METLREDETLRNTSSKYLIKEIETNLNNLQGTISQSQTLAEIEESLNEVQHTSWAKFFVCSFHSESSLHSNFRADRHLHQRFFPKKPTKADIQGFYTRFLNRRYSHSSRFEEIQIHSPEPRIRF